MKRACIVERAFWPATSAFVPTFLSGGSSNRTCMRGPGMLTHLLSTKVAEILHMHVRFFRPNL